MATAASGALAPVLSADAYTKMCKKIAQLTKVIYHLNVRNEDNEASVAALNASHAAALARASAEANERIAKLTQAMASNPEADRLREALASLEKSVAREREEAAAAARGRDREHAHALAAAQGTFKEQVTSLTEQLSHSRRDFESRLAALEESLQSSGRSRDAASERVASLERALEASRSSEQAAVQAGMQELHALRQQADARLQEHLESMHARHADELAAMTGQLTAATEQRDVASAECTKTRARVEQLEEELDTLRHTHQTAQLDRDAASAAMQRDLAQLEAQLKDARERNAALEAALAESSSAADNLRAMVADLHSQQATMSTSSSTAIDTLRREVQAARTEATALQQRIAALQQEARQAADAAQRDAAQAAESARQAAAAHATEVQQFQQRIQAMQQQLDASSHGMHAALQAAQEREAKLGQDLTAQAAKHERDLQLLREQHAASLRDMDAKAAAALSASATEMERLRQLAGQDAETTRRAHEEAFAASEAKFQAALAERDAELLMARRAAEDVQTQLRMEVTTCQAEIRSLKAQLQDALTSGGSASEQLTAARKHSESLQGKCTELDAALKSAEVRLGVAEVELDRCKALLQSLESQHLQTQKAHAEALQSAELRRQRELSDAAASAAGRLSAALATAERDKQVALTELRDTFEKQMSQVGASASASQDRLLQELNSLRDQLRAAHESSAAASAAAASQLATARQQAADEAARGRDEMTSALAELDRKHASDLAAQLQRERDRAAKELLQSSSEHAKAMVERATQLSEHHRTELAATVDRLSHEKRAALDAAAQAQAAAIKAAHDEFANRLRDVDAQLQESASRVRAADAAAAAVRDELARQRLAWAAERQDMQSQAASALAAAQSSLQQALLSQQHQHAALLESIHATHGEALMQAAAERDALSVRLAEMTAKYEARESRPEDVRRVEKLMQLVLAKDEELKKVKSELQWFALELQNRETNFNKVFSRQPAVGVLQPTTPATATAPGMTASASVADSAHVLPTAAPAGSGSKAAAVLASTRAAPAPSRPASRDPPSVISSDASDEAPRHSMTPIPSVPRPGSATASKTPRSAAAIAAGSIAIGGSVPRRPGVQPRNALAGPAVDVARALPSRV